MANETAAAPKKGFLGSLLGGGKSIWVLALAAALVAALGALTLLGNAAATTTYYVLGQAVTARTQITPEMLVPVTTSLGGQPRNAYDPTTLSTADNGHGVFAKVALNAGDIVTKSNSGSLDPINSTIPAGYVAASFKLTAENAVAGKVSIGNYVDVIAEYQPDGGGVTSTTAKVVLHHVLVLDVSVDPSTIAQAATNGQVGANANTPGPESAAVRGGIPSIYTVSLSPEDAVKLALVRDKNLMVVLSANNAAGTTATAQSALGNVFAPDPVADSATGPGGASAPSAGTNGASPAPIGGSSGSASSAPASASPSK